MAAAIVIALAPSGRAQQRGPQPFPQPAQPGRTSPAPPPASPLPVPPEPPRLPNEASLGLPIYPSAQYLTSYDAGQGQRYYLFGSNAGFAELVAYYKNLLRDKGELVFDAPPTHMFEVGRFREEEMAFPPGVTIKDYTWNGSTGFPNPTPNALPARFRSIIQIVPPPQKK